MEMQRRNESEWREIIAEQSGSGQAQAEWCKARNINLYTFRDRKSRLRESGAAGSPKYPEPVCDGNKRMAEAPPVQWLPVRREETPEIVCPTVKVTIGAFTIAAQADFNEALFTRVCKALKTL